MPAHLPDVLADSTLQQADVICFQETWCRRSDATPMIPGYTPYFAGEGKGRGVATFIKNHLVQKKTLLKVKALEKEEFQGLKLYFPDMHILNIYRPPSQASASLDNFVKAVKENIDSNKQTIVCGDLNFNFLREGNHRVATLLKSLGFKQIVQEPTTIYGSCLDHIYLRTKFMHKHRLYHPYYSDHECVCLMLKKPILTH